MTIDTETMSLSSTLEIQDHQNVALELNKKQTTSTKKKQHVTNGRLRGRPVHLLFFLLLIIWTSDKKWDGTTPEATTNDIDHHHHRANKIRAKSRITTPQTKKKNKKRSRETRVLSLWFHTSEEQTARCEIRFSSVSLLLLLFFLLFFFFFLVLRVKFPSIISLIGGIYPSPSLSVSLLGNFNWNELNSVRLGWLSLVD